MVSILEEVKSMSNNSLISSILDCSCSISTFDSINGTAISLADNCKIVNKVSLL